MRRITPVLLLFFLSPAIGELVSGSAPPSEFFRPFPLLILALLYGSGAILVREFTVRWGKGWPTIFILGAAYGILEEGLMVKSFFDPAWMDLGLLGTYGRWAGVNWVWSLDLTIYHSVVSVAIPIFIVEYIFPDRKNAPWLGAHGVRLFLFLELAVVLFGYLALTPYRPPSLQYSMACLVMVGMLLAARHLPVTWPMVQKSMAKKPLWFGLFGFAAIAVFYILLMFGFPEMDVPVGITISATFLLLGICFGVVRYLSGGWSWVEKHKLALASGVLAFFVFLAPLQERDAARADDTTGMTWVGISLAIFLFWLQRRGARKKSISEGEFAESDG